MLILWLHSNLLRLESRSHSGDDGDEDPPVPIPREQSAALPSPSKGNGRTQKLSSSTAKVVKKNGQRGEARNVIDQMSLVVPNGKNKRKIGAFAIPGTIWRLMSLRNQIVVFQSKMTVFHSKNGHFSYMSLGVQSMLGEILRFICER